MVGLASNDCGLAHWVRRVLLCPWKPVEIIRLVPRPVLWWFPAHEIPSVGFYNMDHCGNNGCSPKPSDAREKPAAIPGSLWRVETLMGILWTLRKTPRFRQAHSNFGGRKFRSCLPADFDPSTENSACRGSLIARLHPLNLPQFSRRIPCGPCLKCWNPFRTPRRHP